MTPLWLQNLKRFATGTTVGAKYCMDVNVLNTVAVPVSPTLYAYKERRFHLPATTNINASGGAWIELDVFSGSSGGTAIANTITELGISWNGGEPLEIGKGANSGAVTVIAAVGAGQSRAFGCSIAVADKVWVRAVKNAAITSGELMATFSG